MYSGASADGECPLVIDSSTPSCGNSRFGCWVCTMVTEDKSMAAMIQNDEEKAWMLPMLEFRNEIAGHGDWQTDRDRRDFRKRDGRLQWHNMGILSLERVQVLPQDGFTAHGVHQGDLHAGELNVSRHQVNAFRVVQDTLAGAQRLIHQDTAHSIGQGKWQFVRLGMAQADGQAALRISVNQQHFLPGLRQSNTQVFTGRCLADAAFLVGDGDDLRVHNNHLVSV